MKDRVLIQLGRYGDIMNILPAAREIASRRCLDLMVAAEYASLLEGVTYIKPVIYNGPFTDINGAKRAAEKLYRQVLISQVSGHNHKIAQLCDSFAPESWRLIGMLPQWSKLPLVFDRRDPAREAHLLSGLRLDPSKPLVLVNFTGSSSPYPEAPRLHVELTERCRGRANLVDLGTIRAQRIYDLLGLMDRAALLVTIDTATLHLAAASPVPTVALITDRPSFWHGARPRCNAVLTLRYFESGHRMTEIFEVLDKQLACPPKTT